MLGELVEGTIASLQDTAGPPGVLQAARRVLNWMRQELQPSTLAALTSNMPPTGIGSAEVPAENVSGLFLFCPPFSFSTDSGSASALATATTLSSFASPSATSPITRAFPSPFGTPISSLSSPSASPFPNGTSHAPEAKQGFELSFPHPTSTIYSPWQLPGGPQQVSEPSSSFADMLEFSCQLGLSPPDCHQAYF